ncbi:MAG: dihydroorotate dehydrogenase electron transfer subunit [Acidobacteria bacterium]|jgi:dihydroorotate dehydrogenase electron transfer subunit|nr:dihydroorotate dehydrogenase electron transfer subunit [Acidobacteriota bacterium]
MPYNLTAAVERQEDLGAGYHLLTLAAPEIAREIRAGQFVMIGLTDIDQMLIRRPFSVALVSPGPDGGEPASIGLLYKVIGRGTTLFSRLQPGDRLALLGPLGRGFWLPDPALEAGGGDETELLLVAGGIGNAIFPLLLQELGPRAARTTLFFGGRGRADLTLLDWFEAHAGRVVTATEDGSHGQRGFVTAPLAAHLDADPGRRRLVMACGPHAMLRAVAELCLARGVPCQVAMEETMACGFGVCLGCVVEKREPESDFDRFVRVCTEGPVFDAREIVL